MAELSVYSFSDYRKFLEATFEAKKDLQPAYSLSTYSKQMGFGSSNYARLIIDGKRNLTIENVHGIAEALKLTNSEIEYFESLVLMDQVESSTAKKFYRKRLQKLKKEQPKSSARLPAGDYFSEWYFPVILLLIDGIEVQNAVTRIQERFPQMREKILTKEKLQLAIETFLRVGLLREENAKYTLNYSHQVFHDSQSRSQRHKAFLKSQLELSQRTLERKYGKNAKFYSHTFTIPAAEFCTVF